MGIEKFLPERKLKTSDVNIPKDLQKSARNHALIRIQVLFLNKPDQTLSAAERIEIKKPGNHKGSRAVPWYR